MSSGVMPTQDAAKPPRRRLLARAGLALGSLAVFLAVAEIVVRLGFPHPRYPDIIIPDERVGWLPKPDQRTRAANMFGEYDTEIRTNHEGFRDIDHQQVKAQHVERIAILGDSFTFAEQVEGHQMFSHDVQRLVRNRDLRWLLIHEHSRSPECMNFGVGGYDTQQEVLCYENIVRKYKPDIVVLAMYVHNDILGNAFYMEDEQSGRPHFRAVDGKLHFVPADVTKLKEDYAATQKRQRVRWYHHSQLYNALKQMMWEFRQNSRRSAESSSKPSLDQIWKTDLYKNYRYYAGDDSDPVVKEAETVTRLLLQRLADDVKADGGRLLIVLLPAEENLWPERWTERVKRLPSLDGVAMDFERPYTLVNSVFAPQRDVCILDLRPAMKGAAARAPIFFPRDSHYNAHGQEAVGNELGNRLSRFRAGM